MVELTERYKGYNIYNCRKQSKMKNRGINYIVYDNDNNIIYEAKTIAEIKNKIDNE